MPIDIENPGADRTALAAAIHSLAGVRTALPSPTSYYVRKDGNDANDGSANDAGHAFLTIMRAVGVVQDTIDFKTGSQAYIFVADGRYAEFINLGTVVGSQFSALVLMGNTSNPENLVIAPTGDVPGGGVLSVSGFCNWNINGLTIDASGVSAAYPCNGLDIGSGSRAFAFNVHVISVGQGGGSLYNVSFGRLVVFNLNVLTTYTGSVMPQSICSCGLGGLIEPYALNIHFSSDPACNPYFSATDGASIEVDIVNYPSVITCAVSATGTLASAQTASSVIINASILPLGTSTVDATSRLNGVTGFTTLAAAPTVNDIPAGTQGVFKNSVSGALTISANDGGVIKSVALA